LTMANLSITAAWEETAAFVTREGRLLFPIAFLLLSLPSAVLQILVPPPAPGRLPEPGLWMAFLPAILIVSLIGALAISFLALRPGASVGEALQAGLRRFLPLLGALLALAFGAALLMLPVVLIVAVLVLAAGGNAASPALAVMPLLVLAPPIIALSVRLMLIQPVAAVEPIGPIALIRRSWRLTAGHFWQLLGLLLLVILVVLVVLAAVASVFGILVALVLGAATPGSLALFVTAIVSAVVEAVISAFTTTLIARIYAQLNGSGHAGVFT
jgi:Membrane domain of glycerophosphoryl diester phosphodiesterase